MADENDVVTQLADTRQAAVDSTAAQNAILNQEVAKPLSDPAVLAACTATIAENDKTIQKIDAGIVNAILDRPDVNDFLATLRTTTDTMKQQTAALTDDIRALNKAKTVATALAGILPFVL